MINNQRKGHGCMLPNGTKVITDNIPMPGGNAVCLLWLKVDSNYTESVQDTLLLLNQ